ncbi:MAG: HK97 gp10 family phage protein [Atopobiaceae bacterium]|nr:HK97 gp10 family phage protein [Atopobiaceae bacterium]
MADRFMADFQAILDNVQEVADESLRVGVKAGCELGRDEWQAGAPTKTGGYAKSIRYRVKGEGREVQGHVYSTKPGMPHLLEKGHAKVGGGTTRAIEHIAPAADDAFDLTEQVVLATLGARL